MNYLNSLGTSNVSIAAAGVVIALFIVNMGLFAKNQMPVEGKVRHTYAPFHTRLTWLTSEIDCPHHRRL